MSEHYDVIVAGPGAGGGARAHTQNPALTAMVNAIRAGEHLLGRIS